MEEDEQQDHTQEIDAVQTEKDGINGIWHLAEHEGLTVDLITTLDPDTLKPMDYLRILMPEQDNIWVRISDLTVNDRFLVLEEDSWWSDLGDTAWVLNTGLLVSQGLLDAQEERRIAMHIQEECWDEYGNDPEVLWETDACITIPAGYQPDVVLTAEAGFYAEEQILIDRDGLRVTLEKLGKTPSGYFNDSLYCYLKVENHTEETVPFQFSGLSLNGAFFSQYGELYQLAPGTECCPGCRIYVSDMEESGITQVSDISLLLLTDKKENSGFVGWEGGSWYPVELSVKAEPGDMPEIESLLTENEWVQIGFIGTGEDESWEEGFVNYRWYLLVKNNSDTNLDLELVPPEDDTVTWWISDSEVSAGGWRYMTLTIEASYTGMRPQPTVRFRGVTIGGGGMIFEETDPVVLPDAEPWDD